MVLLLRFSGLIEMVILGGKGEIRVPETQVL